ncbi:hypothetical protein Sipo8835_27180 [Streptomyces ipomoeae]|uniref:Uncharacterized protein n=2 Tax=Streptomyces ipomoeae TaxID=103232 RepID=L1KIM7_9ACTN|nr:hypothetical protein STRIP9103_04030 [Streptomyces ipomoeae 91-03]TQE20571.1 hypothetical protein SipoB123_28265 [Streptomyces ipomoeae]TQE27502.1 hypothetical protein Sipo8835_27180 [Streptomyces ipomoeae]TQE37285.1 hypothetical protein Sipo7851_09770 [Streptomyces ipomoeae]
MALTPRLARRRGFVGARDGASWGQLGKGHCGSSVPFDSCGRVRSSRARPADAVTDVSPDVPRVLM